VENGHVADLRGWQFDAGDEVRSPLEWRTATVVDEYWYAPWERSLQGTKRRTKLSERGVLADLEMRGPGRVEVSTAQGDFAFDPASIGWARRVRFLEGAVEVSRAPEVRAISKGAAAEDFPAAIEDSQGRGRLAWTTYTHGVGDRLWTVRADEEPVPLTPDGRDLAGVALAEDGLGRVWAFWSEQRGGDWDLWGRYDRGEEWSPPERLTQASGADILPVAASDGDGRLYLAWQSSRRGNSDVYVRILDGEDWREAFRVSDSAANEWAPAIDAHGSEAVVAWDGYQTGNYDVYLRRFQDGRPGQVERVTRSDAFEAHADVHYDASGRLWLAWEEGDADWGKDYVNQIRDAGMGLLMRRQVRVAVRQGGELRELPGDLTAVLPEEERQVFLRPRLASDGAGNPWLLFRYRTNTPVRPKPTFRSMWRQAATSFQGGGWLPAVEFADGYGRLDAPSAVYRSQDGDLHAYWAGDGRVFPDGMPGLSRAPELFTARLTSGPAADPVQLQPFREPREQSAGVHPNEVADVARLRDYRTETDGGTLQIVRGDMHRHTDLSWDGNRDGSLWESFRYSLDAAAMDYLGVADHNAGADVPYSWWMIQKAVDLFSLPGKFAPLYGYERSRSFPSGHRNVMFAQRGVPVFGFTQEELTDNRNAGLEHLYEHLRTERGIVMVHTSATGAGSDWTDAAEDVEPLAEIYQGYRTSYEHDGAPRSRTPPRAEQALGFLWNAWAKGLKLGVQSSSDHVSTHGSYGMIFVDEVSRESILEGIRARRAYAATDNILVDFRANGRLMGSAFQTDQRPRLRVHAVGTGPIAKVEVVKNNEYVHTFSGSNTGEVSFEYVDNDADQGESFYYVRVEQENGELAWASPVWVTYAP